MENKNIVINISIIIVCIVVIYYVFNENKSEKYIDPTQLPIEAVTAMLGTLQSIVDSNGNLNMTTISTTNLTTKNIISSEPVFEIQNGTLANNFKYVATSKDAKVIRIGDGSGLRLNFVGKTATDPSILQIYDNVAQGVVVGGYLSFGGPNGSTVTKPTITSAGTNNMYMYSPGGNIFMYAGTANAGGAWNPANLNVTGAVTATNDVIAQGQVNGGSGNTNVYIGNVYGTSGVNAPKGDLLLCSSATQNVTIGGNGAPGNNLNVTGRLSMSNNIWQTTLDGINRLHFSQSNQSFYGSGNGLHVFRLGANGGGNETNISNSGISVGGDYGGTVTANTMFCSSGSLSVYNNNGWTRSKINAGSLDLNGVVLTSGMISKLISVYGAI